MLTHSTLSAKPQDIEKKWYVIDAQDQVLGRLATEAADLLRGKNKPCYTPNIDTGDYVIVIKRSQSPRDRQQSDKKIIHCIISGV
jgi:large subunit ribosomal protein L13